MEELQMKRITSYLTLFLAISGISYAQIVMRIDDNANDAEEHINTPESSGVGWPQGYTIIQSSDTEVGSEGDGGLDWQAVGLQWDQLGIPQGSTIDSAKITLQYDDGGNDGDPGLTIFADDVDNSATFEGLAPDGSSSLPDPASHNITARARTAGVAWAPPLTTDDDIGTLIDTPDLSALVQAIVDRPGWSDNNMLSFMIIPDAYLAAPGGAAVAVRESEFEADGAPSSDQAILTIDFTAPAATLGDVALFKGFDGDDEVVNGDPKGTFNYGVVNGASSSAEVADAPIGGGTYSTEYTMNNPGERTLMGLAFYVGQGNAVRDISQYSYINFYVKVPAGGTPWGLTLRERSGVVPSTSDAPRTQIDANAMGTWDSQPNFVADEWFYVSVPFSAMTPTDGAAGSDPGFSGDLSLYTDMWMYTWTLESAPVETNIFKIDHITFSTTSEGGMLGDQGDPEDPPGDDPPQTETEIAVPVDAATSYIEPLEDLPNSGDPLGWTAIGYDTSQDDGKGDAGNGSANWQAGTHGVGYGDGDDSTLIDDDDDIFGIYTRTEFTITSASRVVEMRWQVSFDDGYVAYVNGVEIARINQSDSPATWDSLASDVVGDAGALSPASVVDHSMLVDGTNVLAVHNMNNQTGSSDLTMIPRLAVDIGPPAVSSIDRVGSSTEAFDSGTGQWTVTFTEEVENVSDDDFLAVRTGDAASDEATVVSGGTTGTVFTVQVTGVTGVEGSLGLNFTGTDVVTVSDGSAIGTKTGQKFVLGSANVPALGLLGLGLAGGVIAAIGASVVRRRKD
jgi:hypothetical protein